MDNPVKFKCFICNEEIINDGINIYGCVTKYSQTPVCELLESLFGNLFLKVPEKCWSCSDCFHRINKYDLANFTAQKIQKELVDVFHRTQATYLDNIVVCNDEKDEVSVGDGISYVIKKEREFHEEFIQPEDSDEYEIHFIVSNVEVKEEEKSQETTEIIQPESERSQDCISCDGVDDEVYKYVSVVETPSLDDSGKSFKKKVGRPKQTHCALCDITFESSKELRDHRNKKHGHVERFVCDVCGVSYKTQQALNIHIGLHQGISPFECDICGKKFTQKGALKRHVPIHTGECPYQCDKCGKRFIHYSSFHMHILAHDDIRDKKCNICGLLLRSSSHLNRHMLVHTGQKPHECPKCGQRFALKYNMMSHLKSHQGIQRKKKFTCKIPKSIDVFEQQD